MLIINNQLSIINSRRERFLILGLCLLAAARVFIFSAAFPFFNNVDEQSHFDLVYKYSYGRLPAAALEKFDAATAELIAEHGTTEYFHDYLAIPNQDEKEWIAAQFESYNNRETWAWPSYYLLAGFWCRLGRALGLAGGTLLYWIRFLNVFIVAAIVWISHRIAEMVFGDPRVLLSQDNSGAQCRIAAPLMAAVFPQDIFYAITGDVLSPLAFAASFFMLLQIYLGDKSCRYHLLAGLVIAATFLTKVSNIAIAALAAVVILAKIKQAALSGRLKYYVPSVLAFLLAATIPVALWLGRNYIVFGDVIGATETMKERHWTKKPFSEIFNHPILTWQGLFHFLKELIKTYWRGEFIWRTRRLCSPLADIFYALSSAIFLICAVVSFVLNKSKFDKAFRFVLPATLLVIAISVLFLAYSSMRLDFAGCVYPSREYPYFTSGRLMAGTIAPFLILYVAGLNYILTKLRQACRLLIVVIIIAGLITISEIMLTWPVFATPYNWFHLK